MISLRGETKLSCFTKVILYTCICICVPFLRIWEAVFRFCNFLLDPHHQPESSYCSDNPDWELDLPVTLFQESEVSDEEMCSICLVEFEGDDSVNKLPKCGHLFHAECLEKWLDRCQFTCPLCRSSLLRVRSSSCKSRQPPPFCIDLSHES